MGDDKRRSNLATALILSGTMSALPLAAIAQEAGAQEIEAWSEQGLTVQDMLLLEGPDGLLTERPRHIVDLMQLAQSNTAGEGGEGGEAGAMGTHQGAEPTEVDDVSLLTQLSLIRGHLDVGAELYSRSAFKAAQSHMKHPGDEIYADLVPSLEARDLPGVEAELDHLANLVEQGAPLEHVEAAKGQLFNALGELEATVLAQSDAPLKTCLATVVRLLRVAAEEFDASLEDGVMVNAHEYQDALGFTRAAGRLLANLSPERRAEAPDVVEEIEMQVSSLYPAWPDILPPEQLTVQPALLYVTAARVEIASLSLP